MRKLTPLRSKVFLKPYHSEDQLERGGMLIPETKREREAEGIVTHIGPECTKVKVGDKVLVPKRNAGTPIEFDGEQLVVISERELLGEVL